MDEIQSDPCKVKYKQSNVEAGELGLPEYPFETGEWLSSLGISGERLQPRSKAIPVLNGIHSFN